MSGTDAEGNPAPSFGEYPADFFDFIIIDECHPGGANDEGNWRGILEYFSPAVQLGLDFTRFDRHIIMSKLKRRKLNERYQIYS